MVQKFGADSVDAIQFCPGGLTRVTFRNEEAKVAYEEDGSILLGDIKCDILRTIPSFVLAFGFPFEGSEASVTNALQPYGNVKSMEHQTRVGHTIKTGTPSCTYSSKLTCSTISSLLQIRLFLMLGSL